jgi:N-glycosylase/DNA lyase
MKLDQSEIKALQDLYNERRNAIRSRLSEFSRVPRSEYFYELTYCLMTPQSSAIHADAVVSVMRQQNFEEVGFDPESILRQKEHYIRFHKNKAKYLLQIRETMDLLRSALADFSSANDLRNWLIKNVKGLGYKEATHFLRNIGRNDGLAILDRHILRNLKRCGVIRSIPSSLTKKKYLSIERRFQDFSTAIGIPLDELDLLFWSMETGEIRK